MVQHGYHIPSVKLDPCKSRCQPLLGERASCPIGSASQRSNNRRLSRLECNWTSILFSTTLMMTGIIPLSISTGQVLHICGNSALVGIWGHFLAIDLPPDAIHTYAFLRDFSGSSENGQVLLAGHRRQAPSAEDRDRLSGLVAAAFEPCERPSTTINSNRRQSLLHTWLKITLTDVSWTSSSFQSDV
jgi:hypothetical protein